MVKMLGGAAAVLSACWLLFFLALGHAPLHSKGEPRVGLQVQEQLRSGNWVLPRLNGRYLPSKPPLFPWLVGLTALATGALDELALRLPSAVLATFVVLLVFWRATTRWDIIAGLCASLTLATSFEWLRAARVARVDMSHTAFVVAALVILESALTGPPPSTLLVAGFYVCVGLAVLAKGPVGFLLPALVGVTYLGLRRDFARLRHLHLIPGTVAAAVIAGSWYVLAGISGGMTFFSLVYRENVSRFLHRGGTTGHAHPIYYYIPGFLVGFLPWSPFLVPLAVHLYRRRAALRERGYLYPLVWFMAVLLFYSLSAGKRTVYILPAYPAAAMLLGAWLSAMTHETPVVTPPLARTLRIINAAGAVLLGVILLVVLASALGARPLAAIAPLLYARDQANMPMVQEILGQRWAALAVGLSILLAVTAAFAYAGRTGWRATLLWLAVLSGGITTIINVVLYPEMAQRETLKPFMRAVRTTVHDGDDLAFYRTFDFVAAFYADRHVPKVHDLATLDAQKPTYLLIWNDEWEHLPADARARLERLSDSNPTGEVGREQMILARLKP